jgi:transposase
MDQDKAKCRRLSRDEKLAALARLAAGESIGALARELRINRQRLYDWRDAYRREGEAGLREMGRPRFRLDGPNEQGNGGWVVSASEVADAAAQELAAARQRISQLECKVGQQQLDLDFFREALRRVGARRPKSGASGGTGSTKSSKP